MRLLPASWRIVLVRRRRCRCWIIGWRWRRRLRQDADRVAVLRTMGGDNGNLRLPDRLRRMILRRRPGMRRTRDDQGAAIAAELVAARARSGRRGHGPDGDGMDGSPSDGRNVFRLNPPVDESATLNVEIIDDRGLVENLRHLGRSHTITARVRIAEKLGGN